MGVVLALSDAKPFNPVKFDIGDDTTSINLPHLAHFYLRNTAKMYIAWHHHYVMTWTCQGANELWIFFKTQ